jgi:putative intracellular protease/amidase
MSLPPNMELVTIATFDSPIEAQIARAALEEAGVTAFIADERMAGMPWMLSNAIGGAKLQVSGGDAQLDLKVLNDRSPADFAAADEAYPAEPYNENDDSYWKLEPEQQDAYDDPDDDQSLAEKSDDHPSHSRTSREENADRALKAAFFGIFVFPLFFYAAWLLLKVFHSEERLAERHARNAFIAAVLAGPFLFLFLWLMRLFVLSFGD